MNKQFSPCQYSNQNSIKMMENIGIQIQKLDKAHKDNQKSLYDVFLQVPISKKLKQLFSCNQDRQFDINTLNMQEMLYKLQSKLQVKKKAQNTKDNTYLRSKQQLKNESQKQQIQKFNQQVQKITSQVNLVKYLKKYLVQLSNTVLSYGVKYFYQNKLNQQQFKAYCSKNIVYNIKKIFQQDLLRFKSPYFFVKIINQQLTFVFQALIDKYPKRKIVQLSKQAKDSIINIHRRESDRFDFLFINKIDFQYSQNKDYFSKIMLTLNQVIQTSEALFKPNSKINNLNLFEILMYQILSKTSDEMDTKYIQLLKTNQKGINILQTPQDKIRFIFESIIFGIQKKCLISSEKQSHYQSIFQQFQKAYEDITKSNQFKVKMKHLVVNEKISSSKVKKYTNNQVKNGDFTIKDSSVLRVIVKWVQELLQKFQDPNQYIFKRIQPFKSNKFSFLNLQDLQHEKIESIKNIFMQSYDHLIKIDLFDMLQKLIRQQKKGYVNKIEDMIKQHNYISQTQLGIQVYQGEYIQDDIANIGIFSSKVRQTTGYSMFNFLNYLIHILTQVSNKFYQKINQKVLEQTNKLKQNKELQHSKRQIIPQDIRINQSYPKFDFVTLKIGDLVRGKCSVSQNQFIKFMEVINYFQKQRPQLLYIIRTKNRITNLNNDVLFNFLLNEKVLCQFQISVNVNKEVTNQKQSKNASINHYLYEIARSIISPLSQLCQTFVRLDPLICKHLIKNQNNKSKKFMHIDKQRRQNLKKINYIPDNLLIQSKSFSYKCQNCNQIYRKNNIFRNTNLCSNCAIKQSNEVINNPDFKQMLKNQLSIANDRKYSVKKITINENQFNKNQQNFKIQLEDLPDWGIYLDISKKQLSPKIFFKFANYHTLRFYTLTEEFLKILIELQKNKLIDNNIQLKQILQKEYINNNKFQQILEIDLRKAFYQIKKIKPKFQSNLIFWRASKSAISQICPNQIYDIYNIILQNYQYKQFLHNLFSNNLNVQRMKKAIKLQNNLNFSRQQLKINNKACSLFIKDFKHQCKQISQIKITLNEEPKTYIEDLNWVKQVQNVQTVKLKLLNKVRNIKFEKSQQLCKLKQLKLYLNQSFVCLEKPINAQNLQLANLKLLRNLTISGGQFKNIYIRNLPLLEILNIYKTCVKEQVKIKSCPSLKSICIQIFKYYAPLDFNIENCKNIHQIKLNIPVRQLDFLKNEDFPILKKCTLKLKQSDFKRVCLQNLNALHQLNLENCKNLQFLKIDNCPQLASLNLSLKKKEQRQNFYFAVGNEQYQQIQDSVQYLPLTLQICSLPKLKDLELNGRKNVEFSGLLNLNKLNIGYPELNNLFLQQLINLQQLKQLCLTETKDQFIQKIPKEVCARLQKLNISKSRIKNIYSNQLSKIQQLIINNCCLRLTEEINQITKQDEQDYNLSAKMILHINCALKLKTLQIKNVKVQIKDFFSDKYLSQIQNLTIINVQTPIQNIELKTSTLRTLRIKNASIQCIKIESLNYLEQVSLACLNALSQTSHIQLSVIKCQKLKNIIIEHSPYIKKIILSELPQIRQFQNTQSCWGYSSYEYSQDQKLQIMTLSKCRKLKRLAVLSNILSQISLQELQELSQLKIQSCKIIKLDLLNLNKLKIVDLSYLAIQQLNLQHLVQLQQVYLNDLRKLSKVKINGFEKLQSIVFSGIYLQNIMFYNNLKEQQNYALALKKCQNLKQISLFSAGIQIPYIKQLQTTLSKLQKLKKVHLNLNVKQSQQSMPPKIDLQRFINDLNEANQFRINRIEIITNLIHKQVIIQNNMISQGNDPFLEAHY